MGLEIADLIEGAPAYAFALAYGSAELIFILSFPGTYPSAAFLRKPRAFGNGPEEIAKIARIAKNRRDWKGKNGKLTAD